jgi:ABC-type Fe3+-hydroxamate transport system substrate-binding protein
VKRAGWLLFAALAAALAAYVVSLRKAPPPAPDASNGSRVVSLAPAISETLFAIGAFSSVVGVSDYCKYPPETERLPRLGTSLTPNYEAIAGLAPTLILSEQNAAARRRELAAIARTELLPWLSLEDITASVRKLGLLVDHAREAEELAGRLERRLGVAEPSAGPRVLLVIGYQPGKLEEVWFIRRNSLHGAMLRAAGGRNAVAEDITGMPRLGLSRVIEIDPEVVVILPPPSLPPGQRGRLAADWQQLTPLSAVRNGAILVLDAPDALTNGPRILELTDRLARLLEPWTAPKAP